MPTPQDESHLKSNLNYRVFRSQAEVKEEVERRGKQLVIRNGNVYDVQEFLDFIKHPGGSKVIEKEFGNDIGAAMIKNDHSHAAYDLLEMHKIGYIEGAESGDSIGGRGVNERLEKLGLDSKSLESVMNKLDFSHGLLYQIWSKELTFDEYMAFIHDPKVLQRSVRLFDSDFCEAFTKTNWKAIVAFWLPFVMLELYWGWNLQRSFLLQVVLFFLGWFAWSFIEYMIHRFIFHYQETNREAGRVMRTIHFLFHGIHHAYPLDKERLVFPILPACAVVPFITYSILIPLGKPDWGYVMAAGGLFGYIIYDVTHFMIHHSKGTNFYLGWVKRTHNKHHYRNPVLGFGVSSSFWDHVFGTLIPEEKET